MALKPRLAARNVLRLALPIALKKLLMQELERELFRFTIIGEELIMIIAENPARPREFSKQGLNFC